MQYLWAAKSWKYYINQTGQEFPLKTNLKIVEILQAMNGANITERPMIYGIYLDADFTPR